jgi:6-phosphogluconolactonase
MRIEMSDIIKIFPSPSELAESLALELINQIKEADKSNSLFTIALSGGNTPKLLFSVLGDKFADSVNWLNVHFFWVDERCVPPDSNESNFNLAAQTLFKKLVVAPVNIHRIMGENDPEGEAERYSEEINDFTFKRNGLPFLNAMLLGLGEDGHTASIFPGDEHLFRSDKICVSTVHPVTGQRRVTLTGNVINNAGHIIFLVTGSNKADIAKEVIDRDECEKLFPALLVFPTYGKLSWYLDEEAGSLLRSLNRGK